MPPPTTQSTLHTHYEPNRRIADAHGLHAYNCGYAIDPSNGSFDTFQRDLVWRLLGNTSITTGTVVLDIGCGIGGPSRWIAQRHPDARVFGVEFLAASVHAAHHRARDDSLSDRPSNHTPIYIQADAQQLPIADATVDVIFNLESALHYPDKSAFLRECRRILRPDGQLCLGDVTATRKWLLTPMTWLNRVASQFNGSVNLWSAVDYLNELRARGFHVTHHENAARPVARSLSAGLHEIAGQGWSAARGYRGRFFYLVALERMLRFGLLGYDLFRATAKTMT